MPAGNTRGYEVSIEDDFLSDVLRAWHGNLEITQLIDSASRLEAENFGPLAAVLYHTWIQRNTSPYVHVAYFNLGATLANADDLAGAEAAYRQALTLSPGFLEPRINLGLVLERTGQLDKATAEWNWLERNVAVTALQNKPALLTAFQQLGRALESNKQLAAKKNQACVVLISNGNPLFEISVKSLVGYLEANGVPCRSVYLNGVTRMTEQQCRQLLDLCEGAMLVGFSLMSKDVKTLLPVVQAIRSGGTPVVWGGIHATAMPAESLKHADFACVGEGELALYRLYQFLHEGKTDYSSIPNLAYTVNGQPVLPEKLHSEASLDALPFPDYKFSDAYMLCGDGVINAIPSSPEMRTAFFGWSSFLYYSQRGCPFSCSYCSNSLYHNIAKKTGIRWYRTVSPSRVKEEVRHHLNYLKVQGFLWINDDDFIYRPYEEIEELGQFFRDELGLRFNINATPSAVTREKIAVLAKYGLYQIAMGVQSGSKRILKDVYQRHVKPEQVIQAANIIGEFYQNGVVADYGFILENPYEQPEDLRDSIQLFMALPKPFSLSLYSLAFFPGTVLTGRALGENVISTDDISIDKDYRESIQPSFAHFLFEANYIFQVPQDITDVLLSDAILKSDDGRYVRLLLANYFISDAVKRMVGVPKEPGVEEKSESVVSVTEQKTAAFSFAVHEIVTHWATPDSVVILSGGGEDIVLHYAQKGKCSDDTVEVAFFKGRIVRLGDAPVVATAPVNALTSKYREKYFSPAS